MSAPPPGTFLHLTVSEEITIMLHRVDLPVSFDTNFARRGRNAMFAPPWRHA
ncbi:hypothetical protein PARU111607_02895 [Palleronia rufa]